MLFRLNNSDKFYLGFQKPTDISFSAAISLSNWAKNENIDSQKLAAHC